MKKRHTIQMKISAIVDISRYAENVDDAVEIGNGIKWKDILADNVKAADGQYELVGAWDNDAWDLELPISHGIIIKTRTEGKKVVTLFKMLGKTIAIWNQDK